MSRCNLMVMGLVAIACTDGGFGVIDETQFRLEGRVVDETGASAADVTVFLVRNRVAESSVQTDAQGRFRIDPGGSGDLDVVVNGGLDRGAWRTIEVPAEGVVSVAPLVLGSLAHRTDLLDLRGVGYEECIAKVLPSESDSALYSPGFQLLLDPENPDVGMVWRWRAMDSAAAETRSVVEHFHWDARAEPVLTPIPELLLDHPVPQPGGSLTRPRIYTRGRVVITSNPPPLDQEQALCRFFDLRHGRLIHEMKSQEGCDLSYLWEDQAGITFATSTSVTRMDWDGRLLGHFEPERVYSLTGVRIVHAEEDPKWLFMYGPSCPDCETTRVIAVDHVTLEHRVIGDLATVPYGLWLNEDGSVAIALHTNWGRSRAWIWVLEADAEPRLVYEKACDNWICPSAPALLKSEGILLLMEAETPGFLALDLTTFEIRPHSFIGLDPAVNRHCANRPQEDCSVMKTEEGLRLMGFGDAQLQSSEVVDGRVIRTLEFQGQIPVSSKDDRWEGAGWTRDHDLSSQIYLAPKGGENEDFRPVTFLSRGHNVRAFSSDGRWVYSSSLRNCGMTRVPLPR